MTEGEIERIDQSREISEVVMLDLTFVANLKYLMFISNSYLLPLTWKDTVTLTGIGECQGLDCLVPLHQ